MASLVVQAPASKNHFPRAFATCAQCLALDNLRAICNYYGLKLKSHFADHMQANYAVDRLDFEFCKQFQWLHSQLPSSRHICHTPPYIKNLGALQVEVITGGYYLSSVSSCSSSACLDAGFYSAATNLINVRWQAANTNGKLIVQC